MSGLDNFQPPLAVSTFWPEQVVPAICAATLIDQANILRACDALLVDDIEKEIYLRDIRTLDTRTGAPNLQESEL